MSASLKGPKGWMEAKEDEHLEFKASLPPYELFVPLPI
jgi:hypothetical protein